MGIKMLTRLEQKKLWNSLRGELIIGTAADPNESSNVNVTLDVDVFWNLEPVIVKKPNENLDKPYIVLKVMTQNKKFMQTLGDLWGKTEDGEIYGQGVEDSILVKVYADDYGSKGNNFISKRDIANALMKRVVDQAFYFWTGLFNGNVAPDNDYAIADVSQILGLEGVQVLQTSIRLQTFYGGVPPEEGPIYFATAPTILEVESKIELVN